MAKFRIYKKGILYYAKEKTSWFTWDKVREMDGHFLGIDFSVVYFGSVEEAKEYLRKKVELRKVLNVHHFVKEIII